MLFYLYRNRFKPKFLSGTWVKYWAKRTYNMPALLFIVVRQSIISLKGAKIGALTIFEKVMIKGDHSNLSVGQGTFIGSNIKIYLHDKVSIGDHVVINSGCMLLTGSHDINEPTWPLIKNPIIIEDYAWVAMRAIILPGVRIGKGAVVGAGAVVTKDVSQYSVVAGNPAKVVSERDKEALQYSPNSFVAAFEAWLGKENCHKDLV